MVTEIFTNTSEIGSVLTAITSTFTGSFTLTMIILIFCFLAVGFMFQLPLDILGLIIFPLIFISVVVPLGSTAALMTIFGVLIFYLSVVIVRYFWLN